MSNKMRQSKIILKSYAICNDTSVVQYWIRDYWEKPDREENVKKKINNIII